MDVDLLGEERSAHRGPRTERHEAEVVAQVYILLKPRAEVRNGSDGSIGLAESEATIEAQSVYRGGEGGIKDETAVLRTENGYRERKNEGVLIKPGGEKRVLVKDASTIEAGSGYRRDRIGGFGDETMVLRTVVKGAYGEVVSEALHEGVWGEEDAAVVQRHDVPHQHVLVQVALCVQVCSAHAKCEQSENGGTGHSVHPQDGQHGSRRAQPQGAQRRAGHISRTHAQHTYTHLGTQA